MLPDALRNGVDESDPIVERETKTMSRKSLKRPLRENVKTEEEEGEGDKSFRVCHSKRHLLHNTQSF